ncbi:MAG TPA: hypothetical protein VFJ53_04205 [Solirubrobacterales bacterium]|nr:hypothetical protein [Solirubrobacterales bacterium]
MRPRSLLLCLSCVIAFALTPQVAAAKIDSFVLPGERSAEAHLAGTHGYRLTIEATNESVAVTAAKGTARVLYYSLAGKLKGDRLDTRLPGVGRIHLRFHEHSRSPRRSAGKCRTLTRKGVFVGWVKIRGERDYTSAESRHLRGDIVRGPRPHCDRRGTARASSDSSKLVSASTTRGKGRLSFMALGVPSTKPQPVVIFVASLVRFRRQMLITTSQSAVGGGPAGLDIAMPPRSASVDPPAPFTGSATFEQEAADQFSWSGDLSVEMPGIGEVSLAGTKFTTALCIDQRCRGDEEETELASIIAGIFSRAAAPTPSLWRWPGSLR